MEREQKFFKVRGSRMFVLLLVAFGAGGVFVNWAVRETIQQQADADAREIVESAINGTLDDEFAKTQEGSGVVVSIGADGSVSINGEQVKQPMPTKTPITDAVGHVSGTLAITNQTMNGAGDVQTREVHNNFCGIEDIRFYSGPDPQPSFPPGPDPYVGGFTAYIIGPTATQVAHKFYYYRASDSPITLELEYDCMVSSSALWRSESTSPGTGRDSSPVFAKEVSISDEWVVVAEEERFATIRFAGMEYEWPESQLWQIGSLTSVGFSFLQAGGSPGTDYAYATVDWDAVEGDLFSGMQKTVSPLRVTGSRNTLTLDLVANCSGLAGHNVFITRPYLKDFSNFAVVDRDGNLVGDILINGGFVADPRYPDSANWQVSS